jgi:polar amino acid transport system substrate-binding protein
MNVHKGFVFFLTLLLVFAGLPARAAVLVRVGINASYAPFESVDDSGRLSGFDIDLVNAWARAEGVTVKFVNLPWPNLLASLESGRVDMIVSAVAVTPERQRRFDFSVPYYFEPQVLLVPTAAQHDDPRELASIGALAGSSALDWLARLGVRPAALQRYDGVPPMLADLRSGAIDGVFGDLHALRRAVATDASLRVISKPQYGRDAYAFVVKKGNRAMLDRANAGLRMLRQSGGIDRLLHAYPGL